MLAERASFTPSDCWPFLDLRAKAGDLELRYLDDDTLFELAQLAGTGVHAEDQMPFLVPWTRGNPLQVARSVLAYQWAARAKIAPQHWILELAVVLAGVPVGVQAISADDFAVSRTVDTGSWLGRRYQGAGIGTRMRALALHLAFDGLGAHAATTAAWQDNFASQAVTSKLGYQPNGHTTRSREGRPMIDLQYRLEQATWQAGREQFGPVDLHGVQPVREFLAIT